MNKYILYGVAALTIFAFGRYTAPEKVKIETKIVEVEKKTEETKSEANRDKHKKTTVVEVIKPDGTKETTTTVEENTTTRKTRETDTVTEREKESVDRKEVTRSSSKTTLSALYGAPIKGGLPVYGGVVSREILGPINLGAFYLTSGVIGVTLGLSL